MQRVPTPVQIFLAVFCGAFVGTVVALQMVPVLWWIGLLAGGLVGYLSYQPMQVIRAIPQALRVAGKAVLQTMRVSAVWLGMTAITCLLFLMLLLICNLYAALFLRLFTDSFASIDPALMSLSFVFATLFAIGYEIHIDAWTGNNEFHHRSLICAIKQANQLRVSWWILHRALPKVMKALFEVLIWTPKILFYYLPITLWLLAKSCGIFVKTFAVTLFKLIHSDERLLCLVDAMIGTAIGFFLHNALAGALIGGVFGVTNYELVSKRWLKLAPQRS